MPRPLGAGMLTIIGGFFIVVGGFAFALVGVIFAIFGHSSGIFLLGILVGFLTILMGLLMIAVPFGRIVWGVLAMGLAIASLPLAFGGLLVGFLCALIGGILSVRWKRPVDRVVTVEARRVPPSSGESRGSGTEVAE